MKIMGRPWEMDTPASPREPVSRGEAGALSYTVSRTIAFWYFATWGWSDIAANSRVVADADAMPRSVMFRNPIPATVRRAVCGRQCGNQARTFSLRPISETEKVETAGAM
jgi:hypothetical protein